MSRKTIISQAGNELKQIIENNGGQFEVYIDTSNLDGWFTQGVSWQGISKHELVGENLIDF